MNLCSRALDLNQQLITRNQQAYHESLQRCFITMAEDLSHILNEQVISLIELNVGY